MVENGVQKATVPGRQDRAAGYATLAIGFHDRDELHECRTDVAQEIVDADRVFGIAPLDGGQGIEIHAVFFQYVQTGHDPSKRPASALVGSVAVVQFFGSVDADPDQEIVLVKKSPPGIVEQGRIGLQGVGDPHSGSAMLFL